MRNDHHVTATCNGRPRVRCSVAGSRELVSLKSLHRKRWGMGRRKMNDSKEIPLSYPPPPSGNSTQLTGLFYCCDAKTYFRFCVNFSQALNSCFQTIGSLNALKYLSSQPSDWRTKAYVRRWLCLLILFIFCQPICLTCKNYSSFDFWDKVLLYSQAGPKLSVCFSFLISCVSFWLHVLFVQHVHIVPVQVRRGCWKPNSICKSNKLSSPKILTLLPQFPRGWDYRRMPPTPPTLTFKKKRNMLLLTLISSPITKTWNVSAEVCNQIQFSKRHWVLCESPPQGPEFPAELLTWSSFLTVLWRRDRPEQLPDMRWRRRDSDNLQTPLCPDLTESTSVDLSVGLEGLHAQVPRATTGCKSEVILKHDLGWDHFLTALWPLYLSSAEWQPLGWPLCSFSPARFDCQHEESRHCHSSENLLPASFSLAFQFPVIGPS